MNKGDYVRTKRGQIHKITDLKTYYENGELIENRQLVHIDNHFSGWDLGQFKELIVKSSPNIIDLIEVGDYVNGCLIVEISEDPFIKGQINLWTNMIISEGEPFPNEYYKAKILEKDIKNVVTKEQFSSMQYNLK